MPLTFFFPLAEPTFLLLKVSSWLLPAATVMQTKVSICTKPHSTHEEEPGAMKVLTMPPSDMQGAQFISWAILKPHLVMLCSLTLELATKMFPDGRTSIVHLY